MKPTESRGARTRETRNAQASVFDFYSEPDKGKQLKALSGLLDQHPSILMLIEHDFSKHDVANTGARGLSVESIFGCLVLKLTQGVSFRALEFALSD
ncbi:MAG: IS5 family transposase [Gammaproteobacteria bacterium]|jgi:IS5 family transposase